MGVWPHALPDSGSEHSFISTHFYILLLFSICLSVRFGSGSWSWSWSWGWTRLAFGLSGTLFDDALRDFFALEWLIFIS